METVHFYVQRKFSFKTVDAVIPFDLARLNEGGAFNLTTGIFTVPVPGIYHFDFSALKEEPAAYLSILLQVNGANIGTAYTGQAGNVNIVSLSASLRLEAGDKVNLFNVGSGAHYDSPNHHTHFSGWLVEEKLM